MRHRRIWMASSAIALLAMGFCGGMFFSRPGHPVMLQIASRMSCASPKQFVVEFRVGDGKGKRMRYALSHPADLEVDGERLGTLSGWEDEQGLRRFLCEGNHIAQLTVETGLYNTPPEVHRVEFAVSRPSLFHAKESAAFNEEPSTSCVSRDPCRRTVDLELSPYEPDDPKVRIFPSEP
jgi:hypothetical protein